MAGACTCRWRGDSTDVCRNSRWATSFSHSQLSDECLPIYSIAPSPCTWPCLHASNTRNSLIEKPITTLHGPSPKPDVDSFLFRPGWSAKRDDAFRLLQRRLASRRGNANRAYAFSLARRWTLAAEWKAPGNGNGLRKHSSAFERGGFWRYKPRCPLRRSANTHLTGTASTCPLSHQTKVPLFTGYETVCDRLAHLRAARCFHFYSASRSLPTE